MKTIFFIGMVFLTTMILAADENISILNDNIKFEIPDGVIDRRYALKVSDFKNISDYSKYWGDKIELRINVLTEDLLRTSYKPSDVSSSVKELLNSSKTFNTENLLALFRDNKTFVLSVYSQNAFLRQSYYKITLSNKIIGESFFIADFTDLEAPPNYAFAFYFVAENSIIQVALSLNDYNDYHIPNSLPEYFIERAGKYYWRNQEAVESFYYHLNSNIYTELPQQLQILRDARDLFLSTLKVVN